MCISYSVYSKRLFQAMIITVMTNCMIFVAKNNQYYNESEIVTEVNNGTTEDIQSVSTLWIGDNTGNNDINEVINSNMVYAIGMPTEVSLTEDTEVPETEEPQIDDENHAPMYYYVIDNNDTFYMDEEWQDYLYNKLVEYGQEDNYKLMIALIYHESHFNPSAISSSNDYGLCQINISNHRWLSKKLGVTDFLDPQQSIDCGVYVFTQCMKSSANVEAALVMYNQGYSSSNSSTNYSRGVLKDESKLVEL